MYVLYALSLREYCQHTSWVRSTSRTVISSTLELCKICPLYAGVYGTRELVNQYAAQLVATCAFCRRGDTRVSSFYKFLADEWDARVCGVYMEGKHTCVTLFQQQYLC